MGNTRGIYFDVYFDEPTEFDMTIYFGTYILMLYYAKQVNYEKAKLLYDVTSSEYYYRVWHNIPKEDIYGEYSSHFNVDEIREVIDFIENELIPELNNEELDLIEKYGGRSGFYEKFYEDNGFIHAQIYDNEYYESHPLSVASLFDSIKDLLSNAIVINKSFDVDVR